MDTSFRTSTTRSNPVTLVGLAIDNPAVMEKAQRLWPEVSRQLKLTAEECLFDLSKPPLVVRSMRCKGNPELLLNMVKVYQQDFAAVVEVTQDGIQVRLQRGVSEMEIVDHRKERDPMYGGPTRRLRFSL